MPARPRTPHDNRNKGWDTRRDNTLYRRRRQRPPVRRACRPHVPFPSSFLRAHRPVVAGLGFARRLRLLNWSKSKNSKKSEKGRKKKGGLVAPALVLQKVRMLWGRRAGKARIQGLLFAAGVVTACCERFLLGCTRAQRPQTGSRAVGFAASSAGPCAGTGCAGVPPPSRGAWHFTAAMRLRGGFARRWVTVEVGENAVCA